MYFSTAGGRQEEGDMFLGCHLSTTKGFRAMGETALSIGADTFQFFSRNPRGGSAKEVVPADVAALASLLQERGFGPLVAHAPYTLNPCAENAKTRDFALLALSGDLKRLRGLPGTLYNLHPGSHVGQGAESGVRLTAELINEVVEPDEPAKILFETMAGKGTEIGRSFGELAGILGKVKLADKAGVCLDTCHIFDGGYDLAGDLDGVLAAFDREIGLGRLLAVHVNDSKNPRESRKDRHARIGLGEIGLEAIVRVMSHPALKHLPFILETPCELDGYAEEIRLLRGRLGEEGPLARWPEVVPVAELKARLAASGTKTKEDQGTRAKKTGEAPAKSRAKGGSKSGSKDVAKENAKVKKTRG
jgi:deoxyribonuclease-4